MFQLMPISRYGKIAAAGSVGAAAIAGFAWYWVATSTEDNQSSDPMVTAQENAVPTVVPLEYKPMTVEEAKETNDELALANVPLQIAAAFAYPTSDGDPLSKKAAVDCLTAAIYYEGGNESIRGQRAIAQVILNRVRHPAFPRSVCGVIFQGSQRRTGCQFTFTCDGSLARKPARASWARANAVAVAAINGTVEPAVGMATHYHANYVVPYWASSLDKLSVIGTHIFYNWKGSWGRRSAFRQAPVAEQADELAIVPDPSQLADEAVSVGEFELTLPPLTPVSPLSPVRADNAGTPVATTPLRKKQETVPVLQADRQSGALRADDTKPALREDRAAQGNR